MSQINPQYVDGLELRIKELRGQLAAAKEQARADAVREIRETAKTHPNDTVARELFHVATKLSAAADELYEMVRDAELLRVWIAQERVYRAKSENEARATFKKYLQERIDAAMKEVGK